MILYYLLILKVNCPQIIYSIFVSAFSKSVEAEQQREGDWQFFSPKDKNYTLCIQYQGRHFLANLDKKKIGVLIKQTTVSLLDQ